MGFVLTHGTSDTLKANRDTLHFANQLWADVNVGEARDTQGSSHNNKSTSAPSGRTEQPVSLHELGSDTALHSLEEEDEAESGLQLENKELKLENNALRQLLGTLGIDHRAVSQSSTRHDEPTDNS
jgi:hypothetical protein